MAAGSGGATMTRLALGGSLVTGGLRRGATLWYGLELASEPGPRQGESNSDEVGTREAAPGSCGHLDCNGSGWGKSASSVACGWHNNTFTGEEQGLGTNGLSCRLFCSLSAFIFACVLCFLLSAKSGTAYPLVAAARFCRRASASWSSAPPRGRRHISWLLAPPCGRGLRSSPSATPRHLRHVASAPPSGHVQQISIVSGVEEAVGSGDFHIMNVTPWPLVLPASGVRDSEDKGGGEGRRRSWCCR
ncbi:hypothetical protein NL676_007110 [Syzygium grande]|nr:hypothetical protein NL676_007110 [Syzygium grande]